MQENKPAVRKGALIWRFLKGSKGLFVISMLLAALTALTDMITPQIIRAAVDNAIGGNEPTFGPAVMRLVNSMGGFEYLGKNLWILALAVLAVALIKVVSQYGFMLSNTRASETLVKTMQDTLYTHIEHLPFSWHMKNHTGDITQRSTSDVETIKMFLSEQLTSLFRTVLMLVLAFIAVRYLKVNILIIILVSALVGAVRTLSKEKAEKERGF